MSEFKLATHRDYATAYREGRCSPVDVARMVLESVDASENLSPPMRFFIAQDERDLKRQAQESADRLQKGEPLSPWDGVPVAVKDEIEQVGYPTTVGTTFLGTTPAEADATVVARLREAGAMLIGKANMHEVGLGVTGINPHHGSARNPNNPGHVTGGSSSGSAAVVAAGLCPVALGADGGGSIRIPAALCGVTGIKPTFGRVSEEGAFPLCWSVAHVGPIAASVEDAAHALDIIAGPDPADPNTRGQPPLDLSGLSSGVEGLRLGWCESWNSKASEPMLKACRAAVGRLVDQGASLVEVEVEHLELVRITQLITIGVEMAAAAYELRREHKQDYGADTRLLLEIASKVPAVDYVRAQRLRTLIARGFADVLSTVDMIVTPMTVTSAPPLLPDAEIAGQSDDQVLEDLTTFSFAPNLTGLPALSVPVGFDDKGLPLGLQLIGRHWEEALLLRTGLVLEQSFKRQAPKVHYDPLGGE